MNNHEEMKKEALEDIINGLEDYNGYYCDFHNEIFNTDYYIIGTYQAKKALEEYGLFNAIDEVQQYEKENFGEVVTDISNPEKLINMLYYIIGEQVLYYIMDGCEAWEDNWNNQSDDDINKEILSYIKGKDI